MRNGSLLLLLAMTATQSGCVLMQPVREMSDGMMRTFRPGSRDYRDGVDEANGEWASVGIEARGERPAIKADPIRKWMMSSKAREIEWNLGIRE
jgi:hypothetical protein